MTDKNMAVGSYTVKKNITADDIDSILVGSLEGGSNYWISELEVVVAPPMVIEIEGFKNASNIILSGGAILFKDDEGDYKEEKDNYTLTLEKMLSGIQKFYDWQTERGNELYDISEGHYDAGDNDCMLQFALFGDIVYG